MTSPRLSQSDRDNLDALDRGVAHDVMLDRFNADLDASTARLYWISEDNQGELFGGEFTSKGYGNGRGDEGDREMAEQAFLVNMLNQCADDAQRDAVKAGRFFWR